MVDYTVSPASILHVELQPEFIDLGWVVDSPAVIIKQRCKIQTQPATLTLESTFRQLTPVISEKY